jgi:hypothetical protein
MIKSMVIITDITPGARKGFLGKKINRQELKIMLNIVRKFIDLFKTNDPIDELDQTNEYIILAKSIDWEFLEKQLAGYYSQTMGAIALPIRLMAGLLILKYKDKLSDENVCKRWKTDYYYQAFTGSKKIKDKLPCDPSMLSRFRQRIGEDGANIIFQASVNIFGQKIKNSKDVELIIDSTVRPVQDKKLVKNGSYERRSLQA